MNDPLENKLRQAGWRRKLTPAEEAELQAWLAAHPEARAGWNEEAALTRLLAKLPDVPVSNNFTARVRQAVEAEAAAETRRREAGGRWSWRSFLPKAAVVAVVLTAGLLGYRGHVVKQRTEIVYGVTTVTGVPSLPTPDVLADFEAISQMTPTPGADQELLTLMEQ